MEPKSGSAWLNKIERECPYQVVLRRKKLMDESDIFDFLEGIIGKFDMFVEDDYANFVRYCFKDKNFDTVSKTRMMQIFSMQSSMTLLSL